MVVNTSYGNLDFLRGVFRYQSGAAAAAAGAAGLSGLGGLGSAGGAAIGAAAGGVNAAGNFLLKQAGEAVKNMAIIMMILGTAQYFLRLIFGDTNVAVITLSVVLFVMAGYALSEKLQVARRIVFIPMIMFFVWYFYFQANYASSFLIYFLTVCGLILVVIDLLTKGQAIKAQFYGLLPPIFLWLDVGLISFLVDKVGLPILPLTESLVLWMPWWAFFGLMTFPLDDVQNSFVNGTMRIMHIIGILYIVFVFIIPMVPALGYDASALVPDVNTLSESQAEMRERLGNSENPFKSNAICFYEAMSKMDGTFSINECVAERQINSTIEMYCEDEGYSKGSIGFDSCVEKEHGALEDKEGQAGGVTSSDLDQHIDIEISKSSYFDDEIFAQTGKFANVQFPVDVRIENPNEEEFALAVECKFESKDKKVPSVDGKVEHKSFEDGLLQVTQSDAYTFLCTPVADLNGDYSLIFTASFNMVTESFLKRIFVNKYDEKDDFQQDAIKSFLDGDLKAYSADEFVRLNFAVGQPSENTVIELDDAPLLVTDVENIGEGNIEVINNYEVILDGLNVVVDSDGFSECSYAKEPFFFEDGNDKGDSKFVGGCEVLIDNSIEEEVKRKGIAFRVFKGYVNYDYILQEQYRIEVTIPEPLVEPEDAEAESEAEPEATV